MKIYDSDDVLEILYNIVAPLESEIPIFKTLMSEDDNSTPESYIFIRDVTDYSRIYGDGEEHLKHADCDIILVSKTKADTSGDIHNVNKKKIQKLLKAEGVSYSGYNLGYNDVHKISEYTWNVKFIYG